MPDPMRVMLTGATGFVGSHLYPVLQAAGLSVVCGTRHPGEARKRYPEREFRQLDVYDYESILNALRGCDAAVYLVHGMADRKDYEAAERAAALNFARVAEAAQLSRIVYLGGVRPQGQTSRHLRSRLRTGELLRSGAVPTLELQASMIIGTGSESWRIVRDLAARLPFMILPSWLDNRTQPIYIDDVVAAIRHGLLLEPPLHAAYPLPGPETLSAREIIVRVARLLGLSPRMLRVPVITPRLSSYWISLVTRANPRMIRELVEGLCSDLVAPDAGFWRLFPEHQCIGFDDAARSALAGEARDLSLQARSAEWLIQRLTPPRLKRGSRGPALR